MRSGVHEHVNNCVADQKQVPSGRCQLLSCGRCVTLARTDRHLGLASQLLAILPPSPKSDERALVSRRVGGRWGGGRAVGPRHMCN